MVKVNSFVKEAFTMAFIKTLAFIKVAFDSMA
jgi:hypothetical protein